MASTSRIRTRISPSCGSADIFIYAVTGETLEVRRGTMTGELLIDTSEYRNGLYSLHIKTESRVLSTPFVVAR